MSKKLIVGANSSLVKKVRTYCGDSSFLYVSHKDLVEDASYLVNEKYECAYIFSWVSDAKRMRSLIDKINNISINIYFISSTAVFALQWQRHWNSYPIVKSAIEKYCASLGITVVRLGVTESIKDYPGVYPYSDYKEISKFIKNPFAYHISLVEGVNEINLFTLKNKRSLNAREKLSSFLESRVEFSNVFLKPIEGFSKYFLKHNYYGYSRISLKCFHEVVIIGAGVGARNAIKKNNKINHFVIDSDRSDITLTKNGFVKTYIGLGNRGLAKFWHGVYIEKFGDFYRKKVPLFVNRGVKASLKSTVVSVRYDSYQEYFQISCVNKFGHKYEIFSNKVLFAAGWYENCRLLGRLFDYKDQVTLDDHIIYYAGEMSTKTAVKDKFYNSYFGIFLKRGRCKIFNDSLIDVRPYSDLATEVSNSSMYLNSPLFIFHRLITNCNIYRLNQAFFNKFGWCIKTRKSAVYCQQVVPRKINMLIGSMEFQSAALDKNKTSELLDNITYLLSDFKPVKTISEYAEAQHGFGGGELARIVKLSELYITGKVGIVGSPTFERLGPVHHSNDLNVNNEFNWSDR